MGQKISYSSMDVRYRIRSDKNLTPVSPVPESPSFKFVQVSTSDELYSEFYYWM